MSQYLGQHFLINESAIERIIAALDLKKGETVIEIGPGAGALTKPLARLCKEIDCTLIAIEKDFGLVNSLVSEFVNWPDIKIISGDALVELPKLINQLTNQQINYKLVGNIPYYITGHLLRTIGELEQKPLTTVLMIQKEVAERVCAKPGEMSLLAAATQIWSKPELLFKLTPKDFDPPPKVHSAVIKLTTNSKQLPRKKLEKYYAGLHIIFKQPRKTLLNNLSEALGREEARAVMEKQKIAEKTRPQDLTIEQIITLSSLP